MAITVAIATVDVWFSFRRASVYNDPIAVWQDAALHQPENSRVQNNLGVVLVDAGQPTDAVPHYRRALELSPEYVKAQSNLGVALVHLQDFAEAQPQFERRSKSIRIMRTRTSIWPTCWSTPADWTRPCPIMKKLCV